MLMSCRVNVPKVAEREVIAQYLYSPTRRNFLSLIDIKAAVLKAVEIMKQKGLKNGSNQPVNVSRFSASSFYSERIVKSPESPIITDIDRDNALEYIFRTETKIVKEFVPKNKLEKIAFEENGVLYCKGCRWFAS